MQHLYTSSSYTSQIKQQKNKAIVSSYKTRTIQIILAFALLRLIIAFTMPLGNDESYYWLYSQYLKWNYFDHPPVVALWVRLFTANLWLQFFEGFVRLGSVVGCALSSWFLYKACTILSSERAGLFVAILYNASFYAGIIAGIYIFPDSPQMVFWTLSLWTIAKISMDDQNWKTWLLFGLATGLCIMSKVHGVFIWGGLGLYILFKRREWLVKPQLYTALLLSLLITCPILIWNIQNNFITYRFHSDRVTIQGPTFLWDSFFREVISHLSFNNPINVVLILLGLHMWYKHRMTRTPALTIYNFISLPLALLLLFISLFRDTTLPHWSGPAYVTLLPLAAVRLDRIKKVPLLPKVLYWSTGTFIIVLLSWTLATHYYPGTFGNKEKEHLGKGDNTLDIYGWKEAGKQFAAIYENDVRNGIMPARSPIINYKWWAAHQDYYFCQPLGIPLIGLGSLFDLHEYVWINKERKEHADFTKAYCIVPSDESYNVQKKYEAYYSSAKLTNVITINRNKKPAHYFFVYQLSGWKGSVPVAPGIKKKDS